MRNRVLSFVLLFAALTAGCGSASNGADKKNAARTTAPGFTLTDIYGKKFSLADFKGKVVFIDFWATWCPPCVMSSPQVEKLVEDYQAKKVVVLSISMDENENAVKRFVVTHKMKNIVALARDSGVPDRYGVSGIPAFFLIDQKGGVVARWEGYSPRMPALWREQLDSLLAS